MPVRDWLYTSAGKKYLLEEYVDKKRSIYSICDSREVYANVVRRALMHHGIPRRGKSEAFDAAIKSGRSEHPTKGRQRTTEEREAIAAGMTKAWNRFSKEEVERRSQLAKQQWANMSPAQQEKLLAEAHRGASHSKLTGYRLATFLLTRLKEEGFGAEGPAFLTINKIPLTIDIYIPHEKIVIEVDGPSHHLPIWGQEELEKTIAQDTRKTDLLAEDGNTVIRLKHMTSISARLKQTALELVTSTIKDIRVGNSPESGVIELDLGA